MIHYNQFQTLWRIKMFQFPPKACLVVMDLQQVVPRKLASFTMQKKYNSLRDVSFARTEYFETLRTHESSPLSQQKQTLKQLLIWNLSCRFFLILFATSKTIFQQAKCSACLFPLQISRKMKRLRCYPIRDTKKAQRMIRRCHKGKRNLTHLHFI